MQWVTLASFYCRRQRWTEMDFALRSGLAAAERDRHASVALFDGASVLASAHRDPALAAKMLEDYLAGSAKSEEAPAFVALDRLARLKEQSETRRRQIATGRQPWPWRAITSPPEKQDR